MPRENDAARSERVLEAGLYLLHLMGCALHGMAAGPRPEGVRWETVHALAVGNSVEGLSWFGAATRDDVPAGLRAAWQREAEMTLFRRVRFDAEREQLFAALGEAELAYLPMKGVLIAGYYLRPEMRSMADNDFLYGFVEPSPDGCGFRIRGADAQQRRQAVDEAAHTLQRIMRSRGYETKNLLTGNHDTFHKPPCYNFEPHRRLMSPSSPHAAYYDNPWSRAIQDEHDPHLFRFSDEDEYLYVLAHAFKHFDNAGCGVRIIADVRVLLDAKGARLDWEYVRGELDALGLAEFEKRLRGLADAVLGGGAVDGESGEGAGAGAAAGSGAAGGGAGAALAGDAAGAPGGEATTVPSGESSVGPHSEAATAPSGTVPGGAGTAQALAARLFARPLDAEQLRMLAFMLGSGTYGTAGQRVRSQLEKERAAHAGDVSAAKASYVRGRLTSAESLAARFPRASRIRVLRPALQVVRLATGFARNPRKIMRELGELRRMK